MELTDKESGILTGREGAVLQKVMKSLVLYGEAIDAERLVDIEWPGHFSIPFATPGICPRLSNPAIGASTKRPRISKTG